MGVNPTTNKLLGTLLDNLVMEQPSITTTGSVPDCGLTTRDLVGIANPSWFACGSVNHRDTNPSGEPVHDPDNRSRADATATYQFITLNPSLTLSAQKPIEMGC